MSAPSATQPKVPLACRYLLAIHIPLTIDPQGRRWTERLWLVDLQRHTDYIRDLTVLCPFVHGEPPEDGVPADESTIRFEPIAWRHSTAASLLRAPADAVAAVARDRTVRLRAFDLWRLVAVGHALPRQPCGPGAARKCLMVNVEASPWRVMRSERAGAWRRFRRAAERLNRWTFSLADIAFFTHEGYRRDLMPRHPERGHVIHASWIDEAVVLGAEAARARWQARAPGAALRLLLAGRLQEDKGIHVLLDALALLRARAQVRVQVAIIGAGELRSLCLEHAARSDERVASQLLDPVPYGEPCSR